MKVVASTPTLEDIFIVLAVVLVQWALLIPPTPLQHLTSRLLTNLPIRVRPQSDRHTHPEIVSEIEIGDGQMDGEKVGQCKLKGRTLLLGQIPPCPSC